MGFTLEVGTACNNKCLFCSAASASSDFSTEQILRLVQEQSGLNCDFLCITGGEATIRPDFLQIVSTAVKAGYHQILLQSNGRAFKDHELSKKVINSGLRDFLISIHGADAATHDALTQSPGSFEDTISGIKNIVRSGGTVTTLTVITATNFSSLVKITEMLFDLGIDGPAYAFPMFVGRAPDNFNIITPRYTDIAPYLKETFSLIHNRKRQTARLANVQDVPFCFLKGFERFANEVDYPEISKICFINEEKGKDSRRQEPVIRLDDQIDNRIQKKIKPPSCKECIYYLPCEGIQKLYIDHYGVDEFMPVTLHDPSVEIKERSVMLQSRMVPTFNSTARFTGRSFGGFLTRGKNLIAVTNRGRHALSLLFGEYMLSEIKELCGDDVLPFAVSLKERGLLSFEKEKTILRDGKLFFKNQVMARKLSPQQEGRYELPLYIPWRESYQVTLD